MTEPRGRSIRWRLRLSEFNFEIKYKKGKDNTRADALSRSLTKVETLDDVDEEIPCFMGEQAEDKEDEGEDFQRLEHLFALEGGTPRIDSINSNLSLRRSFFSSGTSTLSAFESRRKWKN